MSSSSSSSSSSETASPSSGGGSRKNSVLTNSGSKQPVRWSTLSTHGGESLNDTNAIVMPIYQAATFTFESPEDIGAAMLQPFHPEFYGRYATPNSIQAAAAIAELEGAEAGLVTSSGMAAITLTLLTFLKSGDHIIAQRTLYPTTSKFITTFLPSMGIEVTVVDQVKNEEFEDAIKPNTKVIYIESPANPTLSLTDLRFIAFLAGKHKQLVTICDNTFATPFNQRPLDWGINLVVHSATKYIAGHSDVVAGAVVGKKQLIEKLWPNYICFGSVLHPQEAWLLCRGLKTFALRMREHNANALTVAHWLETQEMVERVYYPMLKSHPQHTIATEQMQGGSGMICFEVKGGRESGMILLRHIKLLQQAVSLGGVHSLLLHPASTVSAIQTAKDVTKAGVSAGMVRCSVGIEDVDDIIKDLAQALAACAAHHHRHEHDHDHDRTSSKKSIIEEQPPATDRH